MPASPFPFHSLCLCWTVLFLLTLMKVTKNCPPHFSGIQQIEIILVNLTDLKQESLIWFNVSEKKKWRFCTAYYPLPISLQLTVPLTSRHNGTLWHYVQYVWSGTVSYKSRRRMIPLFYFTSVKKATWWTPLNFRTEAERGSKKVIVYDDQPRRMLISKCFCKSFNL